MSRPGTPEDVEAKTRFMDHYFDASLERVASLEKLAAQGRGIESLTLSLVYLDQYSQLLSWPKDKTRKMRKTGQNFVETLCSYDETGLLSLVHPLQLIEAFDGMRGPWPSRARTLEKRYSGPPYSLMSRTDVSNAIHGMFRSNEVVATVQELWRGTIAAIVYYWMRNRSVHGYGGSQRITFEETHLNGSPAPSLSLHDLLPPLKAMIGEARKRSIDRCEWFGDDDILFLGQHKLN